ncbi:MAG: protein kinase domain-containing protein [Nannocystales bacterium]
MGSQTGRLLGALAQAPQIELGSVGPPRLRPGDVVADSFVVERVLGEGGMGVVYLARDRDLDRPVALKLHRRGNSESALPRMLAEAQSMAKVVHTNVVSVHMVGTHAGALFIAMEYCPLGTLREWLKPGRSTLEVLDLFEVIGRGLGAAHAAGLVHRDFKPENVLLGEDGAPRVADFGLAQDEGPSTTASGSGTQTQHSQRGDDPNTGVAVGTPAYMAPEQYGFDVIDGRADQFAFCVTLFEALTGARPFKNQGEAVLESGPLPSAGERRRATVLAGPLDGMPGIPRAIARVVTKGLSAEPRERYPSMGALLAALSSARRRPRRLWSAAALVGVVAAWGSSLALQAAPPAACDPTAKLDGIWDDTQRARFDSLAEGTQAYEQDAWRWLRASLDDYGERWRTTSREVCLSAANRPAESQAHRDGPHLCLKHARGRLVTFMESIHRPGTTSSSALRAFAELPDPLGCPDAPSTELPVVAVELREELEASRIQGQVSPRADISGQLASIADRAVAGGWEDIASEATRYQADEAVQRDGLRGAEPLYRKAILHGLASGDAETSARAWLGLAHALLDAGGRFEEAADLAELAWASAASHTDARLRFDVAMGRVAVLRDGGREDEAIDLASEALDEQIRERGSTHLIVATTRINLAASLIARRRYADAVRHLEAAYEIQHRAFGAKHPALVTTLSNWGVACIALGDHECAQRTIEEALAIRTAAYGPTDERTYEVQQKLGVLLQTRGRSDEALAVFEALLAHRRTQRKSAPIPFARAAANLAVQRANLGEWSAAEVLAKEAHAAFEVAYGPRHPNMLPISTLLGSLRRDLGDLEGSLERLRAVQGLCDEILPIDHLARVNPLLELGKTQLAIGDAQGAQESSSRALDLLGPDGPPGQLAEAKFVHARAQGASNPKARQTAEEAAALYEDIGPGYAKQVQEVRAWLRADTVTP